MAAPTWVLPASRISEVSVLVLPGSLFWNAR
jgi:hypothetical protein